MSSRLTWPPMMQQCRIWLAANFPPLFFPHLHRSNRQSCAKDDQEVEPRVKKKQNKTKQKTKNKKTKNNLAEPKLVLYSFENVWYLISFDTSTGPDCFIKKAGKNALFLFWFIFCFVFVCLFVCFSFLFLFWLYICLASVCFWWYYTFKALLAFTYLNLTSMIALLL